MTWKSRLFCFSTDLLAPPNFAPRYQAAPAVGLDLQEEVNLRLLSGEEQVTAIGTVSHDKNTRKNMTIFEQKKIYKEGCKIVNKGFKKRL
ncbi:unnamed protein product [Amoebophrya sp. A120]|nr:unnamed protein product [Amoebophrya sp. A120]|eukprot:GSA120T00021264001.1